MKLLKKMIFAGLCLSLALSLSACNKTEETPSSSALPTASPEPSEVYAEPTPSPTPFVPAADLIPPESDVEPDSFEAAFSQNSIDKQYDADFALATSYSMMRQVCDTAARRWSDMIETAYQAALDATAQEQQYALMEEQEKWLEMVDARVADIRAKYGDDSEGNLNAAREVVLFYRERAKELCRIKFEADGELPEFPDLESEFGGPVG